MKFEELLTNEDLLDALYDMRFDVCTPIQEKAIPSILNGNDLIGIAQTGTGKTAAFLLPIIQKLIDEDYPRNHVNCVIMVPTRELAQQIDRQLQGFSYYLPVSGMSIYGGTDGLTYEQQRKGLKAGADIIIATPGRLLSHLNMGYVDLSNVSFFILDEADRMLDMGFFDDIMQIAAKLPQKRQTLLFSATMPPKIKEMAKKLLNNPEEIKLALSKPAEKIQQGAYLVYEKNKLSLLKIIFKYNKPNKVVVFASSKQKVKELTRELSKLKINVAEMHSDLEQHQRDDVMFKFKASQINVVVATDILSRGIDIDNIETVINFDVPREAEDYIHRIGRTARADKEGIALTFINEKERGKFRQIERLLGKEVKKINLPEGCGESLDYGDQERTNSSKRNNNNDKRLKGEKRFSNKTYRRKKKSSDSKFKK